MASARARSLRSAAIPSCTTRYKSVLDRAIGCCGVSRARTSVRVRARSHHRRSACAQPERSPIAGRHGLRPNFGSSPDSGSAHSTRKFAGRLIPPHRQSNRAAPHQAPCSVAHPRFRRKARGNKPRFAGHLSRCSCYLMHAFALVFKRRKTLPPLLRGRRGGGPGETNYKVCRLRAGPGETNHEVSGFTGLVPGQPFRGRG